MGYRSRFLILASKIWNFEDFDIFIYFWLENHQKSILSTLFGQYPLLFDTNLYGTVRIYWNRSIFERAELRDAFDCGGVQTFYRYLLPGLRPFPGSIRHGNRPTRLEIAGEVAFEIVFCTSGDAHRPNNVMLYVQISMISNPSKKTKLYFNLNNF